MQDFDMAIPDQPLTVSVVGEGAVLALRNDPAQQAAGGGGQFRLRPDGGRGLHRQT
jgi:hypothetical protein